MENRKPVKIISFIFWTGFTFAITVFGAEDKTALLIKELVNPDPNVRLAAASSLGKICDENALPRLVKALQEEKDTRVKRALVGSLGCLKSPQAFEPIVKAYRIDGQNDWPLRMSAVEAISKLKDSRVVPELINIFNNDEYDMVRNKAAKQLGMLKDPQAVPALIAAINPTTPNISADGAVAALGEIGDKRAVPALINALENRYLLIDGVGLALGRIGDKSAIPALEKAYKDSFRGTWGVKQGLKMLSEAEKEYK